MATEPARRPRRAPWIVGGVVLLVVAAAALVWVVAARAAPEISVYPDARVLAAAPETTVIVRGAPVDELDDVTVTGSESGAHGGRWVAHPDGDGAAFEPDEPFAAGERVTVDAGRGIAGADSDRTAFTIARAADAPPPPYDDAPTPGKAGIHRFRSAPGLQPPAVEVETATPEAGDGLVFVAPKRGASRQGPLILDAQGEPVWFHPLPGDEQAFDFRTQEYQGKPVLTWWQGRVATYRGYGAGRILDTAYRPVKTVRMGNGYPVDAHEFQLTDKGTALMISYHVVPWDLSALGGRRDGIVEDNVVQEVDIESGAVLFEWHTLGSIPLAESIRPAPTKQRAGARPVAPQRGRAGRATATSSSPPATRARSTRSTARRATSSGGSAASARTTRCSPARSSTCSTTRAAARTSTISLFDNVAEDLPARGRRSRGLVLQLDEGDKTASVKAEFKHPGPAVLSGTQGSMQKLAGGGAFVGWGGVQPWMTEFGADGAAVWDARFLAPKVESYRAYRLPWSAPSGQGRPAVAARAAGDGTDVWVSWNGATGVAEWRVRAAGRAGQHLAARGLRDGDHAAPARAGAARPGARRGRQRARHVRARRRLRLGGRSWARAAGRAAARWRRAARRRRRARCAARTRARARAAPPPRPPGGRSRARAAVRRSARARPRAAAARCGGPPPAGLRRRGA